MRNRNRWPAVLLACGLAAFVVAGCSKSAQTSSAQGGTSAGASGPVTDAASSAPGAGDPAAGKTIFSQNCAQCHGATGTEGGVGPSLKNEKLRKNLAQTIAWIHNPQPPMPKLWPSPLGDRDVADVAAYVQSL